MGRKFTVFALFYFVFKGKFQVQPPSAGAYIGRGDLTEGFLHNLRFGGAYIWRGLYTEGLIFGILRLSKCYCLVSQGDTWKKNLIDVGIHWILFFRLFQMLLNTDNLVKPFVWVRRKKWFCCDWVYHKFSFLDKGLFCSREILLSSVTNWSW